jgi:hypothetical protein
MVGSRRVAGPLAAPRSKATMLARGQVGAVGAASSVVVTG